MKRARLGRRAFLAAASAGFGTLAGCLGRNPFGGGADTEKPDDSAVYNVEAHGLSGDGETEVGSTLQDLLDTVAADGGGVVYFPAGRYRFEQTPLIGSNTTIRGTGEATVFEGVRPDGEQGRALLSNRGYDERGYGGASGWSVRNVRVDSPDSNGIMPAHTEDVRLENIHGDAVLYHHIDVVSSRNVIVDGYRADRGGEADSDAPIQFDAQQTGVSANAVWDGSDAVPVEDDDTPTEDCTLRNFTIDAENGPSHGVHVHRGEHSGLTIADGSITGCQYTALRSDPGELLHGLTIRNVSCLDNARGITLGHVGGGRDGLTITDSTIRTNDRELAAGSGLYAAGFDSARVSNVTVDGEFTNSIIFDDMSDLQMNSITARGAVDQAFRFRENVDVGLTSARAADSGGAGIYSGPGSTVAYGDVTFDNVGSEVVADGGVTQKLG